MNNTHITINERVKQARLDAAKFNEYLEYRNTAVNYLPGITEECLKNYESGKTPPNSDVIAIMADAYNDQDLMNWYCCNACKIGKRKGIQTNIAKTIPDIVMKLYNSPNRSLDIVNILVSIFEDNELSMDELPSVDKALGLLTNGRNIYDNAIAVLEKFRSDFINEKR